ncbi:MAG: hypothetical protein IPM98_17055 [Lewinellaceae bacterium]|nr:hypothetical protein [Lewinellaceae bacterium]
MWKDALCPILATNAEEQRRVEVLFAECLQRAEDLLQVLPAPPKPAPDPVVRAAKRWGWTAVLAAVVLALLLGSGVWAWFDSLRTPPPPPKGDLKRYFSYPTNAVATVCADSLDLATAGSIRSAVFVQTDASIRRNDTLATALGRYSLLPDGCLRAWSGDSLGRDSLRVLLTNSDGATVALDYFPTVVEPRPDAPPPDAVTYRFSEQDVPPPADLAALRFDAPAGWEAAFYQYLPWLKAAFLLVLAVLLYALLVWRARRRRRLVAENRHGDLPPYTWSLRIQNLEAPEPGDDFPLVLNRLRRRTADAWSELDVPATVLATVEQVGRIAMRFRQHTKPPEYLLLIDRQDSADHRAHLFDTLYDAFRANEVLVERFFFDGDPRLCYNEQHRDGLHLAELQQRYPDSRLLVVSTGYALLNPLHQKPARWAEILVRWRYRTLLTPRPLSAFGRRETNLEALLPVLPATLQALVFAADQFDLGDDADFGRWAGAVADAPATPVEPDSENLIPSLRRHYSDDLLQWIAACAVYPALHWELTVYLWRVLFPGVPLRLAGAGADGATMAALTALPWFTKGRIPDPERAQLIHWLETNHPQQHLRVRMAIADQLAQPHNQPPRDSAAWDQYRLNAALNAWRLTDDRSQKNQLEREIADLLPHAEADFTVIKYLDKPKNALQFELPDRWKKILYRGGRPGLGLQDFWSDLLRWAFWLWLAAAVALGLYTPEPPACTGARVVYAQPNKPEQILCLKTPADHVLFLEYLARDAVQADSVERADSVVQALQRLVERENPRADTAAAVFRRNIGLLLFNRGVPPYREADSLRQTAAGSVPPRFLVRKETACAWFARAFNLLPADSLLREAAGWCADPTVFDRPADAGPPPPNCPVTDALLTNLNTRPGLKGEAQYALRQVRGVVMHSTALTARGARATSIREYWNALLETHQRRALHRGRPRCAALYSRYRNSLRPRRQPAHARRRKTACRQR